MQLKEGNYAWAVCASCCLFVVVCIGVVTNGFSIYLPHIHALGITNSQSSIIVNVRGTVALLLMFVIHHYYRLFSVRTGVVVASLCTFVAYILYSLADGSFVMYLIGSALTGVSYAFGAMIILSEVLRKWFYKDFALAIGITAAGSGIATCLIPIYVENMIGSYGLSNTFFFEALIILAIVIVAALLFRVSPASAGTRPFGWNGEEETDSDIRIESKRAKMPMSIWLTLGIVCVIMGAIAGPGLVFLSDLFTTSGFSIDTASVAISAIGVLMIFGKVIIGAAIDRLGTYKALMIAGVLLTIGLVLTPFLNGSMAMLVICLLLMGLGFSMMMLAPSNFAKDISDPKDYFMVVRNFEIVYVFGSSVFSLIPGMLADATGTYTAPYLLFGVMVAVSLALMTIHYMKLRGRIDCGTTEN